MLSNLKRLEVSRFSIYIILLIVIVAASLLSPNFLSSDNLFNVLRQVSVITILAFGAMTLIIGGMIDLSAGAVMAFAGVVSVMVYKSSGNLLLAILAGIAIGMICNLVNAFLVATLKTPAFIVTLGMMLMARGAVLELTQGQNVLQLGDFVLIGQGNLGWLPIPVLVLIGVTIVIWYLMNQTRYGRSVYAVGGNEEAARAAGISVARVKYQAFLVNGALVGIAGVIFMSRVNAGLPNAGVGYELQAITAPIIGGTSFSGGVGTVMGTLAGALIVGILGNIMNLIGIGSYIQQIVMGAIIVIAVAYDVFSKRGKAKTTILKSDAKGDPFPVRASSTDPGGGRVKA
ncbi:MULTISPECIES: ABC transporter permease [Microbacterium]|uniref:ABC transporter permease n=3 Tax=Microbacteriaceae TaxID=85023 RepID=A0AAJ6ANM5_MICMQ|nr:MULTISPECIES: ABC transporter permease [Microbacterium]AZS48844.1 Ribose import permease protein RbsC [Microbacterium oxydans]MBP5803663.1 ABC transporter permease [Microbacterium liquefaciens]UTT52797.1 ABC transporter permease [Microbacterium liquefaciens]WEF20889.1 ABC transporter permease [Microbacterium liquefaciens]WKT90264.1 ABC transporter permease [Microbacterium liquefaciens]